MMMIKKIYIIKIISDNRKDRREGTEGGRGGERKMIRKTRMNTKKERKIKWEVFVTEKMKEGKERRREGGNDS